MKNPHVRIANQYCRDILSGKILACKYVKLACKRHLQDLKKKNWLYHFDKSLAERTCRFLETLRHVKGSWAKKRFILQPWQCFIVCSIFGWVDNKGMRRFSECYLEVPRKNGKSFLAAGIALYMLLADHEFGAEVYCGATSEAQADTVFEPAKIMVDTIQDLRKGFEIRSLAKSLYRKSTKSKMCKLIGKPKDGSNVSCAIIDEYHEHDTDESYDTMKRGTASRMQPLIFVITTAGVNLVSPCYAMHLKMEQILNGALINENIFTIIYGIDENDDWRDFSNWQKANPNLGASINERILKEELSTALQDVSQQNNIITKHLDVWCSVDKAFLDIKKVKACEDLTLTPAACKAKGLECVIALDLASKLDLAVQMLVFYDEKDYYAFGKYYLPSETVQNPRTKNKRLYETWQYTGDLIVTQGITTDFDVIKDNLIEDIKLYNPKIIGFDPFQATSFSQDMSKRGATMVEIGQTVANLSEPMKEMQAAFYSKKIHFARDPVLIWACSNLVAHLDKKDNIFPNKPNFESKIDPAVALIMCISLILRYRNEAKQAPNCFII